MEKKIIDRFHKLLVSDKTPTTKLEYTNIEKTEESVDIDIEFNINASSSYLKSLIKAE